MNKTYTDKEVKTLVMDSFINTEKLIFKKIRDNPDQRELNLAKLDALSEVKADIVSSMGIWDE